MARPTHDLAVKVGEYTSPTGEQKARWMTIGAMFQHDDGGISIKIDAIPVGANAWNGWISVFPKRDREYSREQTYPEPNHLPHESQTQTNQVTGNSEFDDEVPF